jgi:hypothetical protein
MEKINLNDAVLTLVNIAVDLDEALSDKKLSVKEAFNLIYENFDGVLDIIKNGNDLLEEFDNLDSTSLDDFLITIENNLDLRNDALESLVVKLLFIASDVYDVTVLVKELKK